MNRINICVSTDDNYSQYAGVVIASALAHAAEDDDLHIYILDGGVSDKNKENILSLKDIHRCEINFIKIDERLFDLYKNVKTHSYLSLPAYYRLKLASILPEIDKIIYFDCNVVINYSLKDLFNYDLCSNPIGGVLDIKNKKVKLKNNTYVNSGMLVFDLNKIREENIEQKLYEYTRDNFDKIVMGDQQIINEVLEGQIAILPEEWNVQTSNFVNRSSYTTHPKVIHYVSRQKPWLYGSWNYFKGYYFENLQLTPWALKDEEKSYWYVKSEIVSILRYIKYRPLFMFRPRYWYALWQTYIVKHK